MLVDPHDIVGAIEIAARIQKEYGVDIALRTIRAWETRRSAWASEGRPARSEKRPRDEPMPDPVTRVNGSPAWRWQDVARWLERSCKVPARRSG